MIRRIVDHDPAAWLGVGAYFASWGLAQLYTGTDDYWFALRIYPFSLLVTIALYMGIILLLLIWRPAVSRLALCVWAVLLVAEINEILVYATCKLLHNPLLDAAGNRIGQMEMALIWGVEVPKMACARLTWFPGNLVSIGGALVIAWLLFAAYRSSRAT